MNKYRALTIAITLSIAAGIPPVKAQTDSGQSHAQTASVAKFDPSDLTHYIEKHGEEDMLGGNVCRMIGIDGRRAMREVTPKEVFTGKDKHALHAFLIYDSSEPLHGASMKPTHLFFYSKDFSGVDSTSRYFQLDLSGQLEKVTVVHGKYDSNSKPIPGSAVSAQEDIDSAPIRKLFDEHCRTTMRWLRDEMKKKDKAPAAEPAKQ